MNRMRGAALLLVLWLILLLSGLVAGYALNARVASLQGNGVARRLVAEQAARAGVAYAVMQLLENQPARRWAADGSPHQLDFDGIPVQITVRDEAAKIDLNQASGALLQAFFEQLGAPRGRAAKLSAAVLDWRDLDSLGQPAGGGEDVDYHAAGLAFGAKDAPFESVAELQQVLGMSAVLYAAAEPHLTVYSGRAVPDAASADAQVRQAMGLPADKPATEAGAAALPGSGTYSIDSRARRTDGRSVRLSVVLRMGGSGLPGSTYTTLRWQARGGGQ